MVTSGWTEYLNYYVTSNINENQISSYNIVVHHDAISYHIWLQKAKQIRRHATTSLLDLNLHYNLDLKNNYSKCLHDFPAHADAPLHQV